MDDTAYLIVNADDFGQSPGVNRGVIAAHERGVVTSASLMVRWPAAREAAAYARAHPRLGVGLHLDLGEWSCRDGDWAPVYQVVPPDDAGAVAAEAGRQLAAFRELVGRDPTHLDSHQHVHRSGPARSALAGLGRDLGVPVRHLSDRVRYAGDFYGQTAAGDPYPAGIEADHLARLIEGLPAGVTELACHPGLGADVESMYRAERAREVEALCHPRVRAAVAAREARLISFADLPDAGPAKDATGISGQMREHYERVWRAGDAWDLEASAYEQARYDRQRDLLAGRRYGRALELGCGSGGFTCRLAGLADRVLAVDIAPAAVERARRATAGLGAVECRAADVMRMDLADGGPWDLVVLAETVYCLGWLYPVFDVAYLARRLWEATAPGGRLLLANTYGQADRDWLQAPWLIDTYRDLFRNVGFRVEAEDVSQGIKDGVTFRALMTVFART